MVMAYVDEFLEQLIGNAPEGAIFQFTIRVSDDWVPEARGLTVYSSRDKIYAAEGTSQAVEELRQNRHVIKIEASR